MVIYRNKSTDPYFNLASEQYLLDNASENVFMLWRNDRAVIIGKNQNAYAELDLDYTEKNNIKVVRRLTGGGAVFHDVGNVNFSFIVGGNENATLDFERFTRPIISALESLGVKNVCLSGRNDILIDGIKISGNAQSQYNGKTLHHGTLLYSSDLSMLTGALKVDPEKIRSKGIKSVRNRVGNIKEHLSSDMDAEAFMTYLEDYISRQNDCVVKDFSSEDISEIEKLAKEKYSTWEWNFGRSKEFSCLRKRRYPFGGVEIALTLENGFIKNIKISGDFFGTRDVEALECLLKGRKFEYSELNSCVDGDVLGQCIAGMSKEEFIKLLISQEENI
ncbi:MAG: lipoate--protein ligase [Ruminococcaceae bacterium]|nr:lipoate--protein ligase [Oscillospiraceae bacterium]